MLANVYDQLNENGFTITPARGKAPVGTNWQNRPNDDSWVEKFANFNVGIVLGTSLAAIDIDILDESLARDIKSSCYSTLGLSPTRYGKRPKSLIVYRIEGGIKKRKVKFDLAGYENTAVEVLGDGQQFIAYGIHPDTQQPYFWDINIADELIDISINELKLITVTEIESWLSSLKPILESHGATNIRFDGFTPNSNDIFSRELPPIFQESDDPFDGVSAFINDSDIAKMREMLNVQVSFNSDDYDDWIKVGIALKRWHEEHGLELWREWSSTGKFDGGECLKKWATFKETGGNRVTEGSLVYAARQVTGAAAKASIQERITCAKSLQELEGDIANAIRNADDLSDVARDTVTQLWRNRIGELDGIKPSLATTRRVLKPIKQLMVINKQDHAPVFCRGWAWLNDRDKFFDIHTKEELTMLSFNQTFNRLLKQIDEDAGDAAHYVTDNDFVESYSGARYMPHYDLFFEKDNKRYVNLFASSSVPKLAEKYTEDGLKAVEVCLTHIKNICGKRDVETRHFIDWIAYCAQNMGKKINYAPLIQGFEGDGKTTIADMIACCIGHQNIKPLTPNLLQEKFNGWAEGHCLVVLEELRMTGHSRYDVLDTIKPLITNPQINIRKMGRDNYTIDNVSNYIGFTNHRDALPLNDHDRRWWVIFAPWKNRADMCEDVGGFDSYFTRLKTAIEYHGAEIRKYFLEHQISADFNPKGHAPLTDEKSSMINAEKGDDICDLEAFISQGGFGYGKEVIASALLGKAMEREVFDGRYEFPIINTKTSRKIFEQLGYIRNPKIIKWCGAAYRIWNKRVCDFDAAVTRKLLDETVAFDLGDNDDF